MITFPIRKTIVSSSRRHRFYVMTSQCLPSLDIPEYSQKDVANCQDAEEHVEATAGRMKPYCCGPGGMLLWKKFEMC